MLSTLAIHSCRRLHYASLQISPRSAWPSKNASQVMFSDLVWSSSSLRCLYIVNLLKWNYYYYYTRLTALCPGLPRWAGTRKIKPIWILLKQETVSGSGISRATCKSAPRSRQITMPAPHHSVFYRLDALPAAQPTASKHWNGSCQ